MYVVWRMDDIVGGDWNLAVRDLPNYLLFPCSSLIGSWVKDFSSRRSCRSAVSTCVKGNTSSWDKGGHTGKLWPSFPCNSRAKLTILTDTGVIDPPARQLWIPTLIPKLKSSYSDTTEFEDVQKWVNELRHWVEIDIASELPDCITIPLQRWSF